jgi:hypothetical protein
MRISTQCIAINCALPLDAAGHAYAGPDWVGRLPAHSQCNSFFVLHFPACRLHVGQG